ncbi:hypothetical protein KUTeg_008938 [Tegillarca granosa]|uniref:Translation elongation factor EF1B beta/delta subunit guanine nucleotide exchange domain-containing protein n=1 Tax=Tegillarca granosa TaxID=220873 RepID=A0ABQ9FAK6_TEGGR|nr:hypothetical protein KUTeg_008938 [Tegillarca granosa]
MGFGDLKSRAGQQALNDFLVDKSYIEGYEPSQADAVVFAALSSPPPADLAHALRWYNQINSYNLSERSSFAGKKKDVESYGPSKSAPAAGGDDDDDDEIDLFGSDDDDEAAKAEQAKLKESLAKKAKKPAVIAKSTIVLDVKPWDDETDMAELEKCVRTIKCDGLVWGPGVYNHSLYMAMIERFSACPVYSVNCYCAHFRNIGSK